MGVPFGITYSFATVAEFLSGSARYLLALPGLAYSVGEKYRERVVSPSVLYWKAFLGSFVVSSFGSPLKESRTCCRYLSGILSMNLSGVSVPSSFALFAATLVPLATRAPSSCAASLPTTAADARLAAASSAAATVGFALNRKVSSGYIAAGSPPKPDPPPPSSWNLGNEFSIREALNKWFISSLSGPKPEGSVNDNGLFPQYANQFPPSRAGSSDMNLPRVGSYQRALK